MTVELVGIMIQERTKHDLKPSQVNLCVKGNEQDHELYIAAC